MGQMRYGDPMGGMGSRYGEPMGGMNGGAPMGRMNGGRFADPMRGMEMDGPPLDMYAKYGVDPRPPINTNDVQLKEDEDMDIDNMNE